MPPAQAEASARIIHRERVYDGWYKFDRLTIEMPDGAVVERHLLDNGSAAAVLPYDPERGCVLLIHQPRAAVLDAGEAPVLECIAGNLSGDDPEICIRKESLEEAGLQLGALEPIANIWPIPPVSTERVQLYLARYSVHDRVAPGGGASDEDENITIVEVPLAEVRAMIDAGELPDAKTLIAVQALMLRKPALWHELPDHSNDSQTE